MAGKYCRKYQYLMTSINGLKYQLVETASLHLPFSLLPLFVDKEMVDRLISSAGCDTNSGVILSENKELASRYSAVLPCARLGHRKEPSSLHISVPIKEFLLLLFVFEETRVHGQTFLKQRWHRPTLIP